MVDIKEYSSLIQIVGYIVIIGSVAFLTYNQGYFDGLKTLCVEGEIISQDNVVSCQPIGFLESHQNKPLFEYQYNLGGGSFVNQT